MRPSELLSRLRDIFEDCIELATKKNNDYAGEDDALANLGLFGFYGVAVRLSDKLMRLINYAKGKELKIQEEGIRDTLYDIINYAALAIVFLDEEKDGNKSNM
jgi:hypothetical protein